MLGKRKAMGHYVPKYFERDKHLLEFNGTEQRSFLCRAKIFAKIFTVKRSIEHEYSI